MEKHEDRCVGCERCMGRCCSNRNVTVYYCDDCGNEIDYDNRYQVDEDDLCEKCLKIRYKQGG